MGSSDFELVPPAHVWVPDRTGSLGDAAIGVAEVCGIDLDPEQRLAIDAILSVRGNKWAALETCVVEARQNGKTGGILLPIALTDAMLFGSDQLIVWSAHRTKTADEAFLDLDALCANIDAIRNRVLKVSYQNGEQFIAFRNGSRILFMARSTASGRGLSGDRVILDEALFLTPAMMGALMPTLSARPNPQLLEGSSAGLIESDVLRDVRDRGRAGGDPSLVYIEWCAPEGGCVNKDCDHHRDAVGCALDDRDNWRRANPAFGRRITEDYIAAERRSLKPAQFARERLGWWDSKARGGLFHMPAWFRLADATTAPSSAPCLAVHVSPGRDWAAIGAAWSIGDRTFVELVRHGAGTEWVVEELVRLAAKHEAPAVVLAGGMAASSLRPDLESIFGFRVLQGPEVRGACMSLFDTVNAGKLGHRPHPDLDVAVQAAARSSDKGEWIFDADESVDLSPLYAITLAAWAARTEPDVDVSIYHFSELGNCLEPDCECPVEIPPDQAECLDCGHFHGDLDDEDEEDDES